VADERRSTLLELRVDVEGDRVRLTILRADSPAVLRGLMDAAAARHLAQQLIRAAGEL
jgi:hypothetical protein